MEPDFTRDAFYDAKPIRLADQGRDRFGRYPLSDEERETIEKAKAALRKIEGPGDGTLDPFTRNAAVDPQGSSAAR